MNKYFKNAHEIQIIDDFSMFVELENLEVLETSGLPTILQLQREAIKLLTDNTYWEGDGTFYVLPIIKNNSSSYPELQLLIKQSNNGSTFLIY